MRKVCLIVAYDGTRFHGWQTQPGTRTVQSELAGAIGRALDEDVGVEGASRTDAGVHAYGQAAAFVTSTAVPTDRLGEVINRELPDDLRVRAARDVDVRFRPRQDNLGKLYRYTYVVGPDDDPFLGRFATRLRSTPDVDAMREAAAHLEGEHDFDAFRNRSEPQPQTTVRRVRRVLVRRDGRFVHVEAVGDGFLYKMVRNIAGTLLDVGVGRLDGLALPEILRSLDRTRSGRTAPSEGLALVRVLFDADELAAAVRTPRALGDFLLLGAQGSSGLDSSV